MRCTQIICLNFLHGPLQLVRCWRQTTQLREIGAIRCLPLEYIHHGEVVSLLFYALHLNSLFEIRYLNPLYRSLRMVSVNLHQDIRWRDVAMNDPSGVTIADGLEQPLGYLCALLLLKHPLLCKRLLFDVIAVN